MKLQIIKTQKLLAISLLGGTVFAPLTIFASNEVGVTATQPYSFADASTTDPALQLTETSSTTAASANSQNDSLSTTSENQIVASTTDSSPENISSETSNNESGSDATTSDEGVTEVINAPSTIVETIPDVPVFIRTKIEPVAPPTPESFKPQPTLRLAPKTPISVATINPPTFGVVEIIATSTATSTDTIATSTDDTQDTPVVSGENSQSSTTSGLPINDGPTSTTAATTFQSTSPHASSDISTTSDNAIPVVPSEPDTNPAVSSDTTATLTKLDDSTTLVTVPTSE